MGVFTFGYAWVRATHLRSEARLRLDSLPSGDPGRPSLEHYAEYGLLGSRTYVSPTSFEQLAVVPKPGDTRFAGRWAGRIRRPCFAWICRRKCFQHPRAARTMAGLEVWGRIAHRVDRAEAVRPASDAVPGKLPDPKDFHGLALGREAYVSLDILGRIISTWCRRQEMPNSTTMVRTLPDASEHVRSGKGIHKAWGKSRPCRWTGFYRLKRIVGGFTCG